MGANPGAVQSSSVAVCGACHNRRHIWIEDLRGWRRCDCNGGRRAQEAVKSQGAENASPLITWGPGCSKYVRRVWVGRGAHLVIGDPGSIEGCALSILAASEAADRKTKIARLGDLVDQSFGDKGAKLKEIAALILADIGIVICGNEPRHSYNATTLATVLARRASIQKATFVVTCHDPVGLYGAGALQGLVTDSTARWTIGT